jgi:hypothetical protein
MKIFFLFAAVFCGNVFAATSQEVLCFNSEGPRPTRFELRTYFDSATSWGGGYVRYAKSKEAISIVPINEAVNRAVTGRPSDVTSTWIEVFAGRVTGTYELTFQGALVSSMRYTNAATKKHKYFVLDENAERSLERGCQWD